MNLDHDHLHDVLPPSDPEQKEAEEDASGVPKLKGPTPFPGGLSPRALWDLKRVLITKTSHMGGHKFAGNVIVSQQL